MKDIQNHWAQACIEFLIQKKIVTGYPDGSFRPEQPVNRAEFAALITKAFPRPASRAAIQFSDVPDRYWAIEVIQTAYTTGWLTGYPDLHFRPNQSIPRVQVMVAIASGLAITQAQPSIQSTEETLALALSDGGLDDIPTYAREKVAAAIEQRLVVNYPDVRQFRANQPATRAEIAALIGCN